MGGNWDVNRVVHWQQQQRQQRHPSKAGAPTPAAGEAAAAAAPHPLAVVAVPHPLHLHQELCLKPPRRLALAVAARAAQRVDLRQRGVVWCVPGQAKLAGWCYKPTSVHSLLLPPLAATSETPFPTPPPSHSLLLTSSIKMIAGDFSRAFPPPPYHPPPPPPRHSLPPVPSPPPHPPTSSMKMIAGDFSRASANRLATIFSLSPTHLDTRSEEEMEKKVESASVATACS